MLDQFTAFRCSTQQNVVLLGTWLQVSEVTIELFDLSPLNYSMYEIPMYRENMNVVYGKASDWVVGRVKRRGKAVN